MHFGVNLVTMKPLRLLAIGLLALPGAGQTVLTDGKKIADAQKLFDQMRGVPASCEVYALRPRLSFSLRLQSGYFWRLHLKASQIAGEKWIVLAKVTPRENEAKPVYFSDVVQFSPDGDLSWESALGHFWLGEGRYDMQFLMFDGQGRTCRKHLPITARADPSENKLAPLLAPNTVAGISWTAPVPAAAGARFGRLTILMSVPDRVRTPDQIKLMDALTALLAAVRAESVRLVLFDLAQQKELFRQDPFRQESLPEVANILRAVQFEPVTVGSLQNPTGGLDLIENLAAQEIRSPEPANLVIFLGLPSTGPTRPLAPFAPPAGATPQFFYLLMPPTPVPRLYPAGIADMANTDQPTAQLNIPERVGGGGRNARMNAPPTIPMKPASPFHNDCIANVLEQLGGKTLRIDSPDSFAKTVAEMTHSAGSNH